MVSNLGTQDFQKPLLHFWREHSVVLLPDRLGLLDSELPCVVHVYQGIMGVGELRRWLEVGKHGLGIDPASAACRFIQPSPYSQE